MSRSIWTGLSLLVSSFAPPLIAQQWNTPEVLTLVHRGVERRNLAQADSTLQSYRTRAHGFVFFLAQLGEGLQEPPRLVKADELQVEVYWQSPGRSKQIILGWRDGTWLPTDINYHRDHLGIVTNDFGDLIRIGEGDEVRDVPHPLSSQGLTQYDFVLRDSLRLETPQGTLTVHEVGVRPRSFSVPAVVGTLYLEIGTAALVRFRFSFSPAAYRDNQLEDISVVLENSLWDGKYWLPYRQEIELRRRTTWLDFPARGIIRGRWEIGSYAFNLPVDPAIFAGPAIAGLRAPAPDDSLLWSGPLDSAVAQVAAPLNRQDMDALRSEVERIAGTRALGGLSARRLAAGSLSDIIKFNRVQGLALGFGATLGTSGSRFTLRPYAAYGTGDHRLVGKVEAALTAGQLRIAAEGFRQIRDISDIPVITPILNSIAAQEFGKDFGDYVLVNGGKISARFRNGRTTATHEFFYEQPRSLGVSTRPANGTFRSNAPLAGPEGDDLGGYRFTLERSSGGIAVTHDLQGSVSLERGRHSDPYWRTVAQGRLLLRALGQETLTRVYLGWGSAHLPMYKSFVMGGRGTLLGEPFRAYGGRSVALVQTEVRLQAPFPAIPLGSFASTGRTIVVAPFVAAGWTERSYSGLPWEESGGVRPVVGLALEWFMRLIRIEAGVGLRTGDFGVTVEIHRDWWGIL